MWSLCLVTCLAYWVHSASVDTFNPQSNLLIPIPHKKHPAARCVGNSICSFLQANSHGVNVVSYCNCPGQTQCSVEWDPYDGKSITQSQSDQYKYCERAPLVDKCTRADQIAYTSQQEYLGDEKVQSRDVIHCECPDGHNYLDTKYDFQEEDPVTIVTVDYYCLPLKPCNATDFCKDVTVKPGEYIVNPKCLCPTGLACPSITKKRLKKTLIGDMELQNIMCQVPLTGRDRLYSELYGPKKIYRKRWTNKKSLNNFKRSTGERGFPGLPSSSGWED